MMEVLPLAIEAPPETLDKYITQGNHTNTAPLPQAQAQAQARAQPVQWRQCIPRSRSEQLLNH